MSLRRELRCRLSERKSLVETIAGVLKSNEWTVATAESLTGGDLCARLIDMPGASEVVRGGIVAYATDLKGLLLGVDKDLLARRGPVTAEVARQMAAGVRELCRADYGLATTGVAGPGDSEDGPEGLVYIAVVGPSHSAVRELNLSGGRSAVRSATVAEALALLREVVEREVDEGGTHSST